MYLDFEVQIEIDDFKGSITKNVILLVPIFLDNDDIKDKDGEDSLF